MISALPPLSLYVHLPWCVKKCPYCDFNSHELREQAPVDNYIDALLADLEADLPLVWGRSLSSIFIGGGTPSLFPPAAIERLLGAVAARMSLRPAAEITMEANPGALESGPPADYCQAGVNRLSLGVQSFSDESLRRLGRVHDGATAARAVEQAAKAGFASFNLDLMYGLPGQSLEEMRADLRQAIALAPDHISHYQLTLEPNTAFHHRPPPQMPDDELAWEMQSHAHGALAAGGYRQYEVSAFAKDGLASQHNLNYWRFGDYLGLGAGAHGKITNGAEGIVERTVKQRHPKRYLSDATKTIERKTLSASDLVFEFMLGALRLREGFSLTDFDRRTGLQRSELEPGLSEALSKGLMSQENDYLSPTDLGFRYLNDLQALFLDDE
ncbi:MAG: radical SAM family heme chaperone HemW [Lysobacterales bacterium]